MRRNSLIRLGIIAMLLVLPMRVRAGSDPCLSCDVMYASDCNTGLWRLDLVAGTSTLIGTMPEVLFDIAITADGRLVGATSGGTLLLISACDGSTSPLPSPSGGNALGADLRSADLFGQGPPLVRIDSRGAGGLTVVGGTIGLAAPEWCGSSAGDLALSPTDFAVRTALECGCASGATSLQVLDPATGAAISEGKCMTDARGAGYESVYGLAFESSGKLWGVQAVLAQRVLSIDPDTGLVEASTLTGGFTCGFGLACLPCGFHPIRAGSRYRRRPTSAPRSESPITAILSRRTSPRSSRGRATPELPARPTCTSTC